MVKDVIIADEKGLEKKIKAIKTECSKKLHVLADFDRTLTRAYVDGEKTPSLISELRRRGYISPEYTAKAQALADNYHPIEIDPEIPSGKKKKSMHEWWTKHFDLLIKSGFNKKHLEAVINSGKVRFREGALQFLDLLHYNISGRIPIVIISSSGLGDDSIKLFLEKHHRNYTSIQIVSNKYEWDKDGNAVRVREPIIHCMNKDESVLNESIWYKSLRDDLKSRRNVLLLGDNVGDIGMINGFNYKNLIKVGFLNENVEPNLQKYKENFDIVILNDGSMRYVNKLIRDLGVNRR
mgnify:FL=1